MSTTDIDQMTPAELDECAALEVMGWFGDGEWWKHSSDGADICEYSDWRPASGPDWNQLRRVEERIIEADCANAYYIMLGEHPDGPRDNFWMARWVLNMTAEQRLRRLLKAWRAAMGDKT